MFNEIADCDDCQHSDICKWVQAMENAKTEASNIANPKDTPIQIKIGCSRYNKKELRPEGFRMDLNEVNRRNRLK
ncbi:MAG: hypothetical protein WCS56_00355 [Bacilli bacterium]